MAVRDNIPGRIGAGMADATAEDPTVNYAVGPAVKALLNLRGGKTKDMVDAGRRNTEKTVQDADAEQIVEGLGEMPPVQETNPDGTVSPVSPLDAPPADPMEPQPVAKPEPKPDPEALQAEAENIVKTEAEDLERRTWERNINLDYIENPDDIGPVLEANAERLPAADREKLATIEEDVEGNAVEILRDVLADPAKRNQNLTSRQLLAGRQVLVSLSEQVARLADKVANSTATPEEILQFDKLQSQALMIQGYMQNQIRETGRALNSMKIVARTINSRDLAAMNTMLDEGGRSSAQVRANILKDARQTAMDRGEDFVTKDILEVSGRTKAMSSLATFWQANILSGFKTQGVNVISNFAMNAFNMFAVRPMAAAVSPLRKGVVRAFGRDPGDGVHAAEAAAQFVATISGFTDAVGMAWRVGADGYRAADYGTSFDNRRAEELMKGSDMLTDMPLGVLNGERVSDIPVLGYLAGHYERGVRAASFGLLASGDEFFKANAYRQSIYGQAVRLGLREGKGADEISEMIKNPTPEMHKEAMAESERLTYTNDAGGLLGDMAKAFSDLAQKHPALKFIVPFIRTPTAILERGIFMSPLAPVMKEYRERIARGGPDADVALAEMTLGTLMMGAAYTYYQAGGITGGGPENFADRKSLENTGWQPYSIRYKDRYISYRRGTDPLGTTIGVIGTAMDRIAYAKDEATAADIFANLVVGIAAYGSEAPYMTGLASVMKVIDGQMNFDRFMVRQLSGFSPSLGRDLATIYRGVNTEEPYIPYNPNGQGFWTQLDNELTIRTNIGDQDSLPPRRYWDGTPFVSGGGEAMYMYNSVSPIQISNVADKPEARELFANGVQVPEPRPTITIGRTGIGVNLLELEDGLQLYDEYLELVGKARFRAVRTVVESREYQNLERQDRGPESKAAMMLQKAVTVGTRAGKAQFLELMQDRPSAGEKGKLLKLDILEDMVKDEELGRASEADQELLREGGLRGMSATGERQAPQPEYVPDI